MERREKDKGREMTLDIRATPQHKKMKTDRQTDRQIHIHIHINRRTFRPTDTYTHRQAER